MNGSGVPFYRQIIDRVKYGIVRGRLSPGDKLPTVRQLAAELSVNPNTVAQAYREMEIEGVLDTQPRIWDLHRRPPARARQGGDEEETRRKLDQVLTEFLARAHGYGLTLDDVLEGVHERKEG